MRSAELARSSALATFCCTCSIVLMPLSTTETVVVDTPAAAATSDMRTRRRLGAMRGVMAAPVASVFLGVSVGGVVTRDMVGTMVERPVILALANPEPEIMPDEVLAVRPDAIIATGRSAVSER